MGRWLEQPAGVGGIRDLTVWLRTILVKNKISERQLLSFIER